MTSAEVLINDLLKRVEKLEKSVSELQARYWELNRRTMMYQPMDATPNFGGGESRDYKKR